jgi:hypothetical protein
MIRLKRDVSGQKIVKDEGGKGIGRYIPIPIRLGKIDKVIPIEKEEFFHWIGA